MQEVVTMPGDISRSSNPGKPQSVKAGWLADLKINKLKYFVLKAEDFLNVLSESEARAFNMMLMKLEHKRESQGKTPANFYWVVNRDEPYADKVRALIEKHHGIKLSTERRNT